MLGDQLKRKLQTAVGQRIFLMNTPESLIKLKTENGFQEYVDDSLQNQVIIVFSINKSQIRKSFDQIKNHLERSTSLWIAYPKKSSKITTDLDRDTSWKIMEPFNYLAVRQVAIDENWSTLRFKLRDDIQQIKRGTEFPGINSQEKTVEIPDYFLSILKDKMLLKAFESQSFTKRKEQVISLLSAKKSITRVNRMAKIIALLEEK